MMNLEDVLQIKRRILESLLKETGGRLDIMRVIVDSLFTGINILEKLRADPNYAPIYKEDAVTSGSEPATSCQGETRPSD